MKIFYASDLWNGGYGAYHGIVVAESAEQAADLLNEHLIANGMPYLNHVYANDLQEVPQGHAQVFAVGGYAE